MLLYSIVIRFYTWAIYLASVYNPKAKLWVEGRKKWKEQLKLKLQPFSDKKKIWIHCASLGEFEQGRPLIDLFKENHPDSCIVLTFFSPSGFEIQKNYSKADVVFYLPPDTLHNAKHFINALNPTLTIFVKYEFWLNYLRILKKQNRKAYLVSAVFKPHHPFFKWYGGIFIDSLKAFHILFVQDKASAERIESKGFTNVEVMGDTRFDRVIEIKNKRKEYKPIAEFKSTKKLLVAGSTWPGDVNLLLDAYHFLKQVDFKLLLAPHELNEQAIQKLCKQLEESGFSYSFYSKGITAESDILVLDTMGMLSSVYAYATAAYIGGGFNDGLHNCLEAAVYGIPILFYGNEYHRYVEAEELVKIDAAIPVISSEQLVSAVKTYTQQSVAYRISVDLASYFASKSNVSKAIYNRILFEAFA